VNAFYLILQVLGVAIDAFATETLLPRRDKVVLFTAEVEQNLSDIGAWCFNYFSVYIFLY
jgi:hypothetical protein